MATCALMLITPVQLIKTKIKQNLKAHAVCDLNLNHFFLCCNIQKKSLDLKRYYRIARRCSVKKSVLKNLANFTGKYLCWKSDSNGTRTHTHLDFKQTLNHLAKLTKVVEC